MNKIIQSFHLKHGQLQRFEEPVPYASDSNASLLLFTLLINRTSVEHNKPK